MFRIFAGLVLTLLLPACAVTPPSSLFSSLSNDSERCPAGTRPGAQARPSKPVSAASIGGMWDSVKSGLSFGGGSTEKANFRAAERGAIRSGRRRRR